MNKKIYRVIKENMVSQIMQAVEASFVMWKVAHIKGISRREVACKFARICPNCYSVLPLQSEYRTDERDEAYHLTLTIYRGLNPESTSIVGPIVGPATVNIYFVSRSADVGSDFIGVNNSVAFRLEDGNTVILI